LGTAVVEGLISVLALETLALMLLGIAIGFVVGILPGLGGAVALALMLPFTFDLPPVQVFALLLGMLVVTTTTGDLTSVLFGIPGEATSAAAVLDGYPMTRQGEAGRALGIVLSSSAMGSLFGALVLFASVPIMRPLILALGPPEFFAITMLGLTFVVALSGSQILKGFIMASLGLLIAMVGVDPQTSTPRYTFDQFYLWDGIGLVPLVIGLFGGAEVVQLLLTKGSIANSTSSGVELPANVNGVMRGVRDSLTHWRVVIRSSAIGAGIGMVPGLGGSVAQFIAYGSARQVSRTPEKFGKGSVEGLVASGANNNAKDSGSLIPTIGFGIPGSATTAVLLSAFLIAGLNPGTEMLTVDLNVTMSMIWITLISNFVAVAMAFLLLRPLARLTFISGSFLVPFLLLLLALGAYSSTNSYADVGVMLTAAAIGVGCIRWDWPRVPLLLAVVLGPIAERYLFLSNSLFGWEWLTRPVVLVTASAILLITTRPLWRRPLAHLVGEETKTKGNAR
jgi:putative tricarboxylic transport membrane protein